METFKNIVTFTFCGNGDLGKEFVKLLERKYQAVFQDQSTYGIPSTDLKVDDISALCLEALNDNNYNYDPSDEVQLFKPAKNDMIVMHKINPYEEQNESSDIMHKKELRQAKEIIS